MKLFSHSALHGAVLTCLLAGASCAMAEDKVLATVNGSAITEAALMAYGQVRLGGNTPEASIKEMQKELLDDLVNRELVYQEALAKGFDKAPEVIQQLNEQRRAILTNYGVAKIIETTPPSNEALRKAYQTHIVEPASIEYKARHILTETEEAASTLVARLNKGENFIALAKSQSSGPSSTDGGDLGWFSANQMVKPFADAVAALKPGAFTNRPVKSQFGWHVILLEETRKVDPPAFEQVEKQLRAVVQSEMIQSHVDGLRKKAKIEMK